MSLPISNKSAAGIVSANTRPIVLAEFSFTTPIRISSRGDFTYGGNAYAGVTNFTMQVSNDGLRASVAWFDDDFKYSPSFLVEKGVDAVVRYAYGDQLVDADFTGKFSGKVGPYSVSKGRVSCVLVQDQAKRTPRYYAVAQTNAFNHVSPEDTQFETANGTQVYERFK